MTYDFIAMLAQEGNGAVQVDASPDVPPIVVTLIGPIKVWWGEWGSPRHQYYTKWRDAMRVGLVRLGCAVYSPHRAIQGRWNEKLQRINDAALLASDLVLDLTPPHCPANGTDQERKLAQAHNIPLLPAPPGGDEEMRAYLAIVKVIMEKHNG